MKSSQRRRKVGSRRAAGFYNYLKLIEGIEAEALIADKAYDTDAIVEMAKEAGIVPVIPPKSNRKERRRYDEYLYRLRHLVENAFMEL